MHLCDINMLFSESGGGIRTYHLNKISYFKNKPDISYSFIYPSARNEIERDGNTTILRMKGNALPGMPHYRFLLNVFKLRRQLNQLSPDIIEIGSPYLSPLLVKSAASRTGAALTGFWHADYPITYFNRYLSAIHPVLGRFGESLAWRYARSTYGNYAATFASAECIVKRLWENGIPRVLHTPLGVDTRLFHPRKRDEQLRKRFGAEPDIPLFFFPHRLMDEKGFCTLLKVYPQIRSRLGSVIIFAGKGPKEPLLREFMKKNEDVHYLDHVKDPRELAALYASSDAVFALSPFETFGLSAAESMASGCPVIGVGAGGIGELVRKSGGGVTIQNHMNSVQLLDTTVSFMSSPGRIEAGKRARAYAQKNFDWNVVFDRQLDYYLKIHEYSTKNQRISPEPKGWDTELKQFIPLNR